MKEIYIDPSSPHQIKKNVLEGGLPLKKNFLDPRMRINLHVRPYCTSPK